VQMGMRTGGQEPLDLPSVPTQGKVIAPPLLSFFVDWTDGESED